MRIVAHGVEVADKLRAFGIAAVGLCHAGDDKEVFALLHGIDCVGLGNGDGRKEEEKEKYLFHVVRILLLIDGVESIYITVYITYR